MLAAVVERLRLRHRHLVLIQQLGSPALASSRPCRGQAGLGALGISSRSNSARAPKMWKMNLLPDVVGSICSVGLRKATHLDQLGERSPESIETQDDVEVRDDVVGSSLGADGHILFETGVMVA